MLVPPGPIRVPVATKPVDICKGMDGLAALVKEQLKADPFSGVIFCIKILGKGISRSVHAPSTARHR
jgi:transposase